MRILFWKASLFIGCTPEKQACLDHEHNSWSELPFGQMEHYSFCPASHTTVSAVSQALKQKTNLCLYKWACWTTATIDCSVINFWQKIICSSKKKKTHYRLQIAWGSRVREALGVIMWQGNRLKVGLSLFLGQETLKLYVRQTEGKGELMWDCAELLSYLLPQFSSPLWTAEPQASYGPSHLYLQGLSSGRCRSMWQMELPIFLEVNWKHTDIQHTLKFTSD